MKRTLPPNIRLRPAISALILATIGCTNAATYQLDLFSESHPGKYTADPHGALEVVLGNYNALATSGGGTRFWTFCLERQEVYQSGKTYNAESSSAASSGPDPISAGTAYLYQQFATGNLGSLVANFDYLNVNNGGLRLQNSIWALEGELSIGNLDADLKSLLLTQFGTEAAYLADYSGSEVGVLNLTKFTGTNGDSLGGTARQDQLVYWGPAPDPGPPVSVPDGGATLLLLGLSLGGLGACRRFMVK
jgi:hypothetical protein